MDNNLFLGVSLTAAFLGGMVALFAPCCITFLFPAYLGTIFHERKRVVFLTAVFALGLASILVPVAIGMRAIVFLFDEFHTPIYLLGSLLMIFLGVMTLFEVKLALPFPLPHYTMPQKTTTLSTYILGVFSGITSSCCAPVLFAALTLSSLSPTFFISLLVSMIYVLGIVFPLFFLSLIYDKLTNQWLFGLKTRLETPLKRLAAVTFILSGIAIGILALTGQIQMEENKSYGLTIRWFIYDLSSRLQNPVVDILVLLAVIGLSLLIAYKLFFKGKEYE